MNHEVGRNPLPTPGLVGIDTLEKGVDGMFTWSAGSRDPCTEATNTRTTFKQPAAT